jgi:hypothetical protein
MLSSLFHHKAIVTSVVWLDFFVLMHFAANSPSILCCGLRGMVLGRRLAVAAQALRRYVDL